MTLTVVHEAWRPHPLAWIHRTEARGIARELAKTGKIVGRVAFGASGIAELREKRPILRLSDPVMFTATEALAVARTAYVGPRFETMARCYDKYAATRSVAQNGSICPETALGTEAERIALPFVLKPRWGSDSLGLRKYMRGTIPERKREEHFIVQRYIRGADVTIGVLNGQAGTPLHIRLPEGALYTFMRKYVLRPRIEPLTDTRLAQRVRIEALRIAAVLGVDWAARIDFIQEAGTDRLFFLECDVAPLVGLGSTFEKSFSAAGITRAAQLEQLF